jgi:poly(hydroxyalkanoate) depolymerase family esterase
MRRLIKRWISSARAWLKRLLRFRPRRRADQKGFQAPQRELISRLLLSFRAYRLYLPAAVSARQRLPLLVMLHGCQQSAEVFAEGTRMNELADRHDFIVLYPEQSRTANSYGCWNWFHPAALRGSGDAGAIARIVRRIVKHYPVDATRVYVAGMSAGGAMASVLAHSHGELFAACAVHSGLRFGAAVSASGAVVAMRAGAPPAGEMPLPAAFVPTLVIHGDGDRTVNPVNAAQIIEQAQLAETAASRALVESPARRVANGGRGYELRDYQRDGRVVLRKVVVEKLGHAWSGGDDRHPFNDPQGPDASRLIWDFVRNFRRLPDGSHAWSRSWRIPWSAIWDRLRRRPLKSKVERRKAEG